MICDECETVAHCLKNGCVPKQPPSKDEALKLALEQLEECADLLKMFEAPIDSCVGATMLRAEEAITAIKQALSDATHLAAPVQEFVEPEPFGYFQYDIRLDAWVQNRINNKGVAFYIKEKP
jgi:hypothetical protein